MSSTDENKPENTDSKVKTTEEILKTTSNDQEKFGLLIDLIKEKQVSNKDVVNTVLHLVNMSLFFDVAKLQRIIN